MKKCDKTKAAIMLTMACGALKMVYNLTNDAGVGELVMVSEQSVESLSLDAKTKRWIHSKFREWQYTGDSMEAWHPLVLATMASNLFVDVFENLKLEPLTMEKVQLLGRRSAGLCYHLSELVKDEYLHFKEADKMVDQMYEIIGFRR
jgi:hypothetical protein